MTGLNKNQSVPSSLYQILMGTEQTLDSVLVESSKKIAMIAQRKTKFNHKTIHYKGVSTTKLYNFTNVK